jgi:hypothetical protein
MQTGSEKRGVVMLLLSPFHQDNPILLQFFFAESQRLLPFIYRPSDPLCTCGHWSLFIIIDFMLNLPVAYNWVASAWSAFGRFASSLHLLLHLAKWQNGHRSKCRIIFFILRVFCLPTLDSTAAGMPVPSDSSVSVSSWCFSSSEVDLIFTLEIKEKGIFFLNKTSFIITQTMLRI